MSEHYPPWTPEAEAFMLANLDHTYEEFIAAFPEHAVRPRSNWKDKRNRLRKRARKATVKGWFRDGAPVHPMDPSHPEHREPQPPVISGATANVESDIDAIRRAAEQKFEAKQRRAILKNHQRVRFAHGPVAIFFVGDQHIGNTGTDVSRMFAEQEQILATPASYVVLMGDTVDNFIVGKLMAENMNAALNVWEQWELAKYYVERWGKRVFAQNSGNHSQWATKMIGVDYDRELCPDGILYDADELRFTVHVGDHEVRVRTRHKWRGNSQYNPSHALERAAKFDTPDFDVFVGAHVHQGATAREFIHSGKRKLALMSSAYKVIDGYQRESGFVENDASTAVALVINDDGSYWGTSNLPSVRAYMKACYQ